MLYLCPIFLSSYQSFLHVLHVRCSFVLGAMEGDRRRLARVETREDGTTSANVFMRMRELEYTPN